MTRKDYKAIARALHEVYSDPEADRDDAASNDFNWIVNNIADVFAADNPLFDYTKFKDAVYTGKGT